MTLSNIGRGMLTICAAVALSVCAWAVPAYRGPISATQPDGSEISIRKFGDEFAHMILSDDGYPLIYDAAAGYRYAHILDDGSLISSGIAVACTPSGTRAADDVRAYKAGFDKQRIQLALDARAAASSKADARALRAPARTRTRAAGNRQYFGLFPGNSFPTSGTQHALVLLVEFSDVKFGSKNLFRYNYPNLKDGYTAADYWTDALMQDGFDMLGGSGSCRQFFLQNSSDAEGNPQFDIHFDVVGPITLSKTMSYYGGNNAYGDDRHPEEMVIDACKAIDDQVDFSLYDHDDDGFVDNVYVFYAGYGEADSDEADAIWPHAYYVYSGARKRIILDNVMLDSYGCCNETEGTSSKPAGIGTFTHEFSHVIGLPDLYATSYTSSFTPGAYSVLDYGPYNNDGRTPPNYSSFERTALGWMTCREFLKPEDAWTIPPLAKSNSAFVVPTDNVNEYFLLESRTQTGWDKYIPGHGMIVWHVDYNEQIWQQNIVNNSPRHQYVDMVEATNSLNENARASHTYPGTRNVRILNFAPWSNNADDYCMRVSISGIEEDGEGNIALHCVNGNPMPPSGISELPADDSASEAPYYNLQGIKIAAPIKGQPYIHKGHLYLP